uniref:Uncharacterized protein n=1 Tax=Ananas comosus var. bracteatus TaxID=296719 RepID=A0A6V7Q4D5_ANACO|nr:unnamed protein product [Ananas comosus var. bracteatus]
MMGTKEEALRTCSGGWGCFLRHLLPPKALRIQPIHLRCYGCNRMPPGRVREAELQKRSLDRPARRVQNPPPGEATKHVKSVRSCSVNLIRSSDPFCAAPSTAALLHRFKSRWQAADVRVLSAGIFAFKPLRRPEFCDRRRDGSSPESEQKAEQPVFFFPMPNFPFLPSPPSFLPPNPLQPPPSVLPPLPFQPSPPPFVNLPPLPFLTPPPPPPPPAFQLPPFPFPFPPSPLFPGIPPAFTSKNASP